MSAMYRINTKNFWTNQDKLWSLILLCLFKNILTYQCFQHGIFNSDIMLIRNHKTSHLWLSLIQVHMQQNQLRTPSVHRHTITRFNGHIDKWFWPPHIVVSLVSIVGSKPIEILMSIVSFRNINRHLFVAHT